MKTLLLHPEDDFDLKAAPPPQSTEVVADLGLEQLIDAMAASDAVLRTTATAALLQAIGPGDPAGIAHRQDGVRDALRNAQAVRALYALVVDAIESRKQHFFSLGLSSSYPTTVLHGAVDLLRTFTDWLHKLRAMTDTLRPQFTSAAFTGLFATVARNMDDAYFATVQQHLEVLRFRHGVRLSARLGDGNIGTGYQLRLPNPDSEGWLPRLLGKAPHAYTWHLPERDEAGARALADIHNRGIVDTADALAQAAEHVLHFFETLRAELAFYVGALNLHDRLQALEVETCLPAVQPEGAARLTATALRDPALAHSMGSPVVASDCHADDRNMLLITGANQGGKSTFLRALGLAQVMLHAGLFVAARDYAGPVRSGVFTHAKREEDATLKSGKFDEELQRMSTIADSIRPGALVLFNEPFAATNEREGSEIALQVMDALRERGIAVWCVSHLATLARELAARHDGGILFLRADRRDDGSRSFVIQPGEPLDTSYGEDLYRKVFGAEAEPADAATAPA